MAGEHQWGEGSEAPGVTRCLEHGLEAVRVENRFGALLVFRQGAQAVEYRPQGEKPVLWLSKLSRFQEGSAIRGGVPICFPWFGPHPADASKPAHGFARTQAWAYLGSDASSAGTQVTFELTANAATRALWPFDFSARLRGTLGSELELVLEVENRDSRELEFQEALHSYFAVGDIREVVVEGLQSAPYLDQVTGTRQLQTLAELQAAGEVDRVYTSDATCRLRDTKLGREIVVEKSASGTTVVWNPWVEKAKRLADFGDEEYREMLCVESANAHERALRLAPGERHAMRVAMSSRLLPAPG